MPRRSADWRNPLHFAFALAALLILGATGGQALPDDRSQPIHISADKALRDEKQGVTIYSGNVQMNQGSMHIEADTLTIYHIEAEADKIVAKGRPAKMRQRPDLEKGPVHARALVIEYYQREEKVHLQDEARIEQDGAIVTGDSIDYFIAQELVKADSDGAREGNRVQVVIPPSVQQDLNLAPDTPPDPNSPATPDDSNPVPGQAVDANRPATEESASGPTESQ
jgi:lipopolysaccharide export system protein LptA